MTTSEQDMALAWFEAQAQGLLRRVRWLVGGVLGGTVLSLGAALGLWPAAQRAILVGGILVLIGEAGWGWYILRRTHRIIAEQVAMFREQHTSNGAGSARP